MLLFFLGGDWFGAGVKIVSVPWENGKCPYETSNGSCGLVRNTCKNGSMCCLDCGEACNMVQVDDYNRFHCRERWWVYNSYESCVIDIPGPVELEKIKGRWAHGCKEK